MEMVGRREASSSLQHGIGVGPVQGSVLANSCITSPLMLVFLSTGMCLQAFIEAFFYLAQKKFKMLPLHEQVASLIDLCEYRLSLLDEKRLVCGRRGTSGGRPPYTPQDAAPFAQPAEGIPQPHAISASKPSHYRRPLS